MTVTDKDAKQLQKMFEKLEKQNKKEWDILKKHPNLAKQPYSTSSINKMLSKEKKQLDKSKKK